MGLDKTSHPSRHTSQMPILSRYCFTPGLFCWATNSYVYQPTYLLTAASTNRGFAVSSITGGWCRPRFQKSDWSIDPSSCTIKENSRTGRQLIGKKPWCSKGGSHTIVTSRSGIRTVQRTAGPSPSMEGTFFLSYPITNSYIQKILAHLLHMFDRVETGQLLGCPFCPRKKWCPMLCLSAIWFPNPIKNPMSSYETLFISLCVSTWNSDKIN